MGESSAQSVPAELIENKIHLIRGHKVMLDRDLAHLYGVETRILNQAVRRNIDRFPADFMLSVTRDEIRNISQFVICPKIKESRVRRAHHLLTPCGRFGNVHRARQLDNDLRFTINDERSTINETGVCGEINSRGRKCK